MNYPEPRIKHLKAKTLIGMPMTMSLTENKTGQLWSQFMPRLNEIANRRSNDKLSIQVYPSDYHNPFNPSGPFVKWAAVEVQDQTPVPHGMESFFLSDGLYAVFDYKGSSADHSIFNYIFSSWLPNSGYAVDDRPHFEVLGDKYRNNDPESEEEIWIPVVERLNGEL